MADIKKKNWIMILLPLFLGTMIYVLFRPPLSWFPDFFGWEKAVVSLSWIPAPISTFILYHLSDVLWAISFAEMIYTIKRKLYLAFIIVIAVTVLLNLAQHFRIAKGTADILDVIYIVVSLSIYFIIRKRIKKHEKT